MGHGVTEPLYYLNHLGLTRGYARGRGFWVGSWVVYGTSPANKIGSTGIFPREFFLFQT